mmetsp:Transcript_3697/g.10665  ORF Transcript_3697/g.10665 Transcript_3697/m.10665 type:complete len:217 (-) Transcript_3697:2210-2860(-)
MLDMPQHDISSLEFSRVLKARAVGFKFRPFVMNSRRSGTQSGLYGLDPRKLKAGMQECNVSVIATIRGNTVLEALSWYRAHELNRSQFHIPQESSPPLSSAAVNIQLHRLGKWLKNVEQMNAKLKHAIDFFDRPTMRVLYEDFLNNPIAVARSAAGFLRVSPSALKQIGESVNFQKFNDGKFRNMVANWEEACQYLQGMKLGNKYTAQADCPTVVS